MAYDSKRKNDTDQDDLPDQSGSREVLTALALLACRGEDDREDKADDRNCKEQAQPESGTCLKDLLIRCINFLLLLDRGLNRNYRCGNCLRSQLGNGDGMGAAIPAGVS